MARKVFFSFHYKQDNWRTSQVRNIGAIEGNQEVSDNDWETIKKGGDAAIEKRIANQMRGRDCTIVLIGKDTAIVKVYDPPYKISTNVYDYIKTNIATWVEDAIAIRKKY